jgi:adenylate cyclase
LLPLAAVGGIIVVSEDPRGRERRRFAAILVAGYSRLSPGEEKSNFAELRAFLTEVLEPQITRLGGNIFKEAAELVLAEFEGAVDAARCTAALRDAIVKKNRMLPEDQRIAVRLGINFGEIIGEEGDVFGDGVNIAARIEALAKPGSVYLAESVRSQIADRLDMELEDLGPQDLKNISRPISLNPAVGGCAEWPDWWIRPLWGTI